VAAEGEVLNCNVYDIATHAAVELAADKLIVMSAEDLQRSGVPPWLPLNDAIQLLREVKISFDIHIDMQDVLLTSTLTLYLKLAITHQHQYIYSKLQDPTTDSLATFADSPTEEYPNSLAAAVRACKHGVKRTHVIDAHVPGALLVELYSRDGLGVMVSGEK